MGCCGVCFFLSRCVLSDKSSYRHHQSLETLIDSLGSFASLFLSFSDICNLMLWDNAVVYV